VTCVFLEPPFVAVVLPFVAVTPKRDLRRTAFFHRFCKISVFVMLHIILSYNLFMTFLTISEHLFAFLCIFDRKGI
jgi:hypothetical protein